MYDVIVIGGGPAGVTAALRARELGASVALVERDRLGGTCTNDGCVPTRVLAHAARLIRDSEQYPLYGLSAQPLVLDFQRLMARVQEVVEAIHEKKQLASLLSDTEVALYAGLGPARFVDPHTIQVGEEVRLQAEKFILSVGGHARRINFPGAEHTLTHSDVWSLKKLPRSLAIVGGAATGCQLASVFAAFGSQVTILEVSPRLLNLEDEMISQAVAKSFKDHGIRIITGIQGVDRVEKHGELLQLYYKQADGVDSLEAEAVAMAVGWPGNIEQLNLDAAGVKTERGYVLVDDYLQTSAPHIFAAGDITGRMMLVQSAGYEATAAAENAMIGVGQPQKHQIVPHGGFTDPEYGSVGLTEAQARAKQEVEVAVVPFLDMDRAVIDGHTLRFLQADRRPGDPPHPGSPRRRRAGPGDRPAGRRRDDRGHLDRAAGRNGDFLSDLHRDRRRRRPAHRSRPGCQASLSPVADVRKTECGRMGEERPSMTHSPPVHPAGKPSLDDSWHTVAEFALPSEPGNERRAMEMVAGAVKGLGVPSSRFENLKTAVAEASMNAMEHGNQYNADLEVAIRVSSTPGCYPSRSPIPAAGRRLTQVPEAPDLDAKLTGSQTHRGWGLHLIKNMVDEIRFSADGAHHTIELIMYLEEHPSQSQEG